MTENHPDEGESEGKDNMSARPHPRDQGPVRNDRHTTTGVGRLDGVGVGGDDDGECVPVNCGLEIKTPPGLKKLLKTIRPALNLYEKISKCEFGDFLCKAIVYQNKYLFQIPHHTPAANLDYISFADADKTG